ncbi:MAG: beta-lactamase family protein [Prevotellaceae bacterium]|jgi:CubicO group peptidase (beta-lactamase class C family)|nr:beta-lactamase family protein [Prevotellaceae bacterium]
MAPTAFVRFRAGLLKSKRQIFCAAGIAAVAAAGLACLALFLPRTCLKESDERPAFPLPPIPRLTNEICSAPAFDGVNEAVAAFLKKWRINGASLAIAKDGRLLYARGFGYADVEQKTAVTPGHVFRVASVSKLITATAVMKLVEEGRLGLDDKVFGSEGILRDFVGCEICDERALQITVRRLLEHSAGWDASSGDDPMFMPHAIAGERHIPLPVSIRDIACFVLSRPLHFEVGHHSEYSNFGYALLGYIVEKAAGVSCEDYVREALLLPMGITNMRLGNSYPRDRYANETSYYDAPGAKPVAAFDNPLLYVPKCRGGYDMRTLGAAGGWVASPIALLRFALCIDGRPETPDILSPESVAEMVRSDSIFDPFGWRMTDERRWIRTGTLIGTSAAVVRDTSGWCWAFVTNTTSKKGADFPFEVEDMMQGVLHSMAASGQLTGSGKCE